MSQKSQKEIAEFYDEYSNQQSRIGVNIRHRTIMKRLKSSGMTNESSVLEIGCGIGTLTSLLVKKAGSLLAVDISPSSIEIAKKNLGHHSNISFLVSDMSNFDTSKKYDFIVLPDVLEHIPVEQHSALFKTFKSILAENGKICIHIPDPYALEWIRANQPELLQIIDQSIYSNLLTDSIYQADLALHKLERYCLQKTLPDYQWIEVIHRPSYKTFEKKQYIFAAIDEVKSKL
jgi:cyclopropane fatty-acyl-phospholipid synthase-like methyltransferase